MTIRTRDDEVEEVMDEDETAQGMSDDDRPETPDIEPAPDDR